MTVHEHLLGLLEDSGLPYRTLHHEPTRTSEESARVRGEPLRIGAKALVVKVGGQFRLFVLSAADSLDPKRLRKLFGAKKSRFATREELKQLTGLPPGAVPPFGRPVLDLDLYVDERLLECERVAFNAGSLTDSVIMPAGAYRALARPAIASFAVPAEAEEG